MKKLICQISLAALLSTTLVGCSGYNPSKGVYGTGIGAGAGAIAGQAIGGNTEATLIGAGAGALLGYIIGNEIDKYDKEHIDDTFENTPSHQPVAWSNPDKKTSYKMTPKPAYQTSQGRVCRDAKIQATIDGRIETTHTTACRDQYGKWQLQ